MPELEFSVTGAEAARHAATPTLNFQLAIREVLAPGVRPTPIQSVSLQCQVRIDANRRGYQPQERERLSELFGAPERWGETLHSLLWMHVHLVAPAFESMRVLDLPVPCSFDFNLAATKYFHGLEQGEVPLLLLFSGSVFYHDESGGLAMDSISWNQEARYRLPVAIWQDMMERYYPNQAWLGISRQAFEVLHEYKRRHGYTGFDEAITSLLPQRSTRGNRAAS